MTEPLKVPSSIRDLVTEVKEPISASALETLDKYTQIHDRSYQLHTFVEAWKEQQNSDRKMRATYATWLLIVVSVQILLINIAFFMIGARVLEVEKWVANVFITAVLVEVSSLVLIVVKYLFPEGLKSALDILDRIYKDTQK